MVCELQKVISTSFFMCRKKVEMNQLTLNELTKKKSDKTYIVVYAIKIK